ncbi:MAG TPA: hypothetical protein VMP03_02910, partial [Methylomirabilota bacterium]|nr:hypothetical protein [Methylomirabilota bacterium]
TAARSDMAAAESRANELAVLIGGQGGVAGAAEVIDSDGFRALRSREIALRSRQSELAVALLPAHPQMQTIRSQIEDIERQQVAEARRALSTLRNDARVAEARIAALTASLDQLKATSAENGENEVELRALEREAASQRNLLEGLLVRYSEAIARQNAEILPADARVISRASVPGEPTFPKVAPMTVVSALAGLLLVVAWIVSLEFLSGRALVRVTATPGKPRPLETLSTETSPSAPTMEDRASRFRSMVETALAENDRAPAAPPAEGVDGDEAGQGVDPDLVIADAVVLHAALVAGGASRVAMMTAGDGSALAPTIDAFARAAADEGTSIVVVDMVAAHAGRGPGLSDLMAGEAAFGEIIHRNRATRAHQIEVGSRPINPQSFGQVTLETILDALANAYDVVVLSLGDLPAETLSPRVAALADRVVVVGPPGDPLVRQAQALVSEAGVRFVNVVPPVGDWSEAAA